MRTARRTDVDRELVVRFDALGRAYRLQVAARWSLRALLAGAAVDALLIAAQRTGVVPGSSSFVMAIGPLLLIAIALAGCAIMRPNDIAVALLADRALGLRERLTTAVALPDSPRHQLASMQVADALHQLRSVRPAQAFPIRLSRREAALFALAILSIVAAMLVPARIPSGRDQARIGDTIRREADRLSAVSNTAMEQRADDAGPAVAAALRDAGKGLEKSQGSPERAVAALAQASQQLAGVSSVNSASLREALSRAGAGLRSEAVTRQSVGTGQNSGDQTASALRDLANRVGDMTADERAAASRAVHDAANGAASFDPRLTASLRQAASAMAAGGPEAATLLERAADQAAQVSQAIARQDVVDQARAQLDQSRSAISDAARQSTAERGGSSAAESRSGATSARGEGSSGRSDGGDTSNGDGSNGQGSGAGKGSVDSSTRVFDPDAGGSHMERVDSGELENPTARTSDRTGDPNAGTASADYRGVYAGYRDKAMAATQDRYIPLDLKDLVKDYFASLDPN